ncbi:ABC transporter permease [Flaviflexus huanghaiensis]|uniref:ABC transporter permease n=1 Tax=Flaviflexus huanghaiensis TaxID=1111473 RepID=UPI0015FE7D59|nr:ABC transporter permease [Flaviflexus huanghaiensis]
MIVEDTFAWLADASRWSGPGSIPQRLVEHIGITFLVVLIAALIAIPIGILVGHARKGRAVVVSTAGALRAIPSLGLLTLAGLYLGIGLKAPIIALIVLAIPSLLAGAYAGVESVEQGTVDAARAIGMSERQIITRVELPLASPVIIGGIRAATLQVVATATLAAYVSDYGLGRYVFAGLKGGDYSPMLGGAILVSILAILLEVILAGVHYASRRLSDPASTATAKGIL